MRNKRNGKEQFGERDIVLPVAERDARHKLTYLRRKIEDDDDDATRTIKIE